MADSDHQLLLSPSPSPNPNPNPNPNSPPQSPAPLPARKSERKRKIREFLDMSQSRKTPTIWSDSDELSLLRAAEQFRRRTGAEPKGSTMKEFFEEAKGQIGESVRDFEKVGYKLRRLKAKWASWNGAAPAGTHEREVCELARQVWRTDEAGEKEKNEIQEKHEGLNETEPIQIIYAKDPSDKHPFLTEALNDYYSSNKRNFSEVSFEKGMRELDLSSAKELERKWKKQLEAEMRFKMRKHEIVKEIYGMLGDVVKGQVS